MRPRTSPAAPKTNGLNIPSHSCPGTPASLLYTRLRHEHGLSHAEATRRLREALKGYFRTV